MKTHQYFSIMAVIWGIWGCLLDDPMKTVAWVMGIIAAVISIFSTK